MDNKTIVPYVRIAKEIATKIMKGEYKENNKPFCNNTIKDLLNQLIM